MKANQILVPMPNKSEFGMSQPEFGIKTPYS